MKKIAIVPSTFSVHIANFKRMTAPSGKIMRDWRMSSNRAQPKDSETACNNYRQIRLRYLNTHRRDILRDGTAKRTEGTLAGNRAAHYRNAVTDAGLFESGVRKDKFHLINEIYELNFEQILFLSKN